MNKFDFRLSSYFTGIPLFFGFLLGFIALVLMTKSIILGIIILLVSISIISAHYRLAIDLETKTYHDYLWILGMKFGEKEPFDKIDYLFIKKVRVSQTISMRAASSTFKKDMYNGYIRFSENKKVHLFTLSSRTASVAKLKKMANSLNVKMIDYSEGEPKEIKA